MTDTILNKVVYNRSWPWRLVDSVSDSLILFIVCRGKWGSESVVKYIVVIVNTSETLVFLFSIHE